MNSNAAISGLRLGVWYQAWLQFSRHRLRTFLTLLGVVFGVASVVAMLSLAEGARKQAQQVALAIGLNTLMVQEITGLSEERLKTLREKSAGLSESDARAMRLTFDGLDKMALSREYRPWQIVSEAGYDGEFVVHGVAGDYFSIGQWPLAAGRHLTNEDNVRHRFVVVLSPAAAARLFPDDPREELPGRLLKINRQWFTVVGMLAPKPGGMPARDNHPTDDTRQGAEEKTGLQQLAAEGENGLFVPLESARHVLSRPTAAAPLSAIKLMFSPKVRADSVAPWIDRFVFDRHARVRDFQVVVPARLLQQTEATRQIFTVFMLAIAAISLVVGGIGIMNILLAMVLERTQEIGLLRALGARRKDIRNQFLAESLLITVAGALIGAVLGWLMAIIVQGWAGWPVAFSWQAMAAALLLAVLVGLVFGWLPAVRAAGLHPAIALKQ